MSVGSVISNYCVNYTECIFRLLIKWVTKSGETAQRLVYYTYIFVTKHFNKINYTFK